MSATSKSLLFALSLVTLWTVGCGQAATQNPGHHHSHAHRQRSRATVGTRVREVPGLALALASRNLITSVQIVPAVEPAQYGAPENSRWVNVIFTNSSAPATVAAECEGWLIAERMRLDAQTAGDPPIVGVTFMLRGADGSDNAVNASPIEDDTNPGLSVQGMQSTVTAALAKDGLTVDSLSFQDEGSAGQVPLAVATIPPGATPAAFVQSHPFVAEEVAPGGSMPVYVEIVDGSGNALEAVGIVPNAGATLSWQDPSFGCFALHCSGSSQ